MNAPVKTKNSRITGQCRTGVVVLPIAPPGGGARGPTSYRPRADPATRVNRRSCSGTTRAVA
jgi:hypothetical protein